MMRRNFVIRELRAEDKSDLIDAYFSYFDEVKTNKKFGLLLPNKKPTLNEETKWFSEEYSSVLDGDTIASVAVVDGKAVGLCDVRSSKVSPKEHVGRLGIAIRNGYRGIGIGRALMEDVLYKAKKRFEIVELAVLDTNKEAIRMYKSSGFKEYGSLPKGVKRGKLYFNDNLMYIDLTRSSTRWRKK